MSLVRITAVLVVRDGQIVGYEIENELPLFIEQETLDRSAPRGLCKILDMLRQLIRRECAATVEVPHA